MSIKEKSVLVFGGGDLQLSIIKECKKLGLLTVVMDPNPEAPGQKIADTFEVVGGNDFEGTCRVIEKYSVKGIVTAATDKPLVMMARVAEKYDLPFFSEETARRSTDKYLMKQVFQEHHIPCAKGRLIDEIDNSLKFPLILKPRDNSGSRGIIFCQTKAEAEKGLKSALEFSNKETILAEEIIYGQEYSIESLHFDNQTKVLQFTEKITTPPPYNVELGHIQPAELTLPNRKEIKKLVGKIAEGMGFQNCSSHTELMINKDGIFVIETSPRLGGDFITSQLTPFSTGINMERELIKIAFGEKPDLSAGAAGAAAIFYFDFDKETVTKDLSFLEKTKDKKGIIDFSFDLEQGMKIPQIKNSLDRYGYIILTSDNREALVSLAKNYLGEIADRI